MSATAKIGLGVAAGYLLGRTKKFKLAITVGSMLAGQRIATDRQGLMRQGAQLIDGNPELSKLRDEITGKMLEAAKAAAITTATSRLEGVTKSLRAGVLPEDQDEGEESEDVEDAYDEDAEEDADEPAEDEAPEDEEDSDEPAEDEAEDQDDADDADEEPVRRAANKARPARKATRKATAAAGPAKKTAAKKTAPAKKTAKKAAKKA